MTTLRDAARQALEALEYIRSTTVWQADKHAANPAITALRAALAQEDETQKMLRTLGFDHQCPESIGVTLRRWKDGYAAALAQQEQPKPTRAQQMREAGYARRPTLREMGEQEQEPVAWTDRELQLIDGMIEVQLRHAAQCNGIANRTMAARQQGWDMERVALLRKIKSNPPRREPEQEPVAMVENGTLVRSNLPSGYTGPLYTAPPRHEWRGLTMQEINALPEVGGRMWNMGSAVSVLRAIRAVEAALKERNT